MDLSNSDPKRAYEVAMEYFRTASSHYRQTAKAYRAGDASDADLIKARAQMDDAAEVADICERVVLQNS